MFHYTNRFRVGVIWLTEWPWFDTCVIFLIIVGSVSMAMYDFKDPTSQTVYNKTLDTIQLIVQVLFTIEASLKIISMGLYKHRNAYLSDGWNTMDLFVVVMAWVDMLVTQFTDANLAAFKVIRALRVIRPLRSVKRIPSMRRLVAIILRSFPELGNTLAFMLFFFVVFGIIGIQNFHGAIYNRCRLTEKPVDGKWALDTS